MRNELQEIEIIENYLMGKMNANDKADFEKQLETDSNLVKNVELQKSLMAGLERMGLKNDLLQAKRSLFLRKVWTWFGALVLLTGLSFGVYKSYESGVVESEIEITTEKLSANDKVSETKDERLKIQEEGIEDKRLKTKNEGLKTKDKGEEIKEATAERLVILSDSRSGQDDIPDFAEIPVKQFQTFSIDPRKASSITGEEGTIIDFPANAFDTKSNERVEIKLQEFYKLSDMVFANLTTQTKDGQLIETGGMVYIEAYQGDGKLNLAEGKSFDLKFPYQNKKEGMQTFLGQKDERGNVVWDEEKQEANIALNTSVNKTFPERAEIFTIVETMPVFPGCESNRLQTKLVECTHKKVSEHLKNNVILPSNKTGLGGKNTVYVRYSVNEFGIVDEVSVVTSQNKALNPYAIATVKGLPRFVPGRQRGKTVRVQYTVPVKFDIQEGAKGGMNEVQIQKYLDSLDTSIKLKKEKRFEELTSDSIITSSYKQSLFASYALSSSNLGYINCDRYPLAVKGKSSFNVFEQDEGINCSLILHSVRGIVSPRYIKQGKYIFPQLPNEEVVSVLAFKTEGQKNYVSYAKTTHNKQEHRFEFEPLTKEKLKEITAELDAIRN